LEWFLETNRRTNNSSTRPDGTNNYQLARQVLAMSARWQTAIVVHQISTPGYATLPLQNPIDTIRAFSTDTTAWAAAAGINFDLYKNGSGGQLEYNFDVTPELQENGLSGYSLVGSPTGWLVSSIRQSGSGAGTTSEFDVSSFGGTLGDLFDGVAGPAQAPGVGDLFMAIGLCDNIPGGGTSYADLDGVNIACLMLFSAVLTDPQIQAILDAM